MKQIFSCLLALAALLSVISCEKDNDLVNDNTSEPSTSTLQISLDSEELTLEIGNTAQLVASFTPTDAENKAHEWISSNSEIATVDAKGLVKAVSIGNANIVAKSLATGTTATCKVTVVDKVVMPTSVKLNKTKESILVGETLKLEATVAPDNASDKSVIWSSSAPTIASVDGDGMVRGLLAGTAEITATTVNGKTTKCNISVENPIVEFSNLKISTIDETSAEVSFSITAKGITLKELGICYDIDRTPTIESSCIKLDESKSYETTIIRNLRPQVQYFIRAYAKTNSEIYYSDNIDFYSPGSLVVDFKATDLYRNAITIESPESRGYDEIKICYGETDSPKVFDKVKTIKLNNSKYSVTIDNLEAGKKYYLRTYQENGNEIVYSDKVFVFETIGDLGSEASITYKCVNTDDTYSCNTDTNKTFYFNPTIKITFNIKESGTYKLYRGVPTVADKQYLSLANGTDVWTFLTSASLRLQHNGTTRMEGIWDYKPSDIIFIRLEDNIKFHFKFTGYTLKAKRYNGAYGRNDIYEFSL